MGKISRRLSTTCNRKGTGITQDSNAKNRVKANFRRNPTHSISKAAANLGYSETTTWKIAKELKIKPFRIIKTQKLSPVNYQMRYTFCLWFINMLKLKTDFASNVIFSDEKWWVLDSKSVVKLSMLINQKKMSHLVIDWGYFLGFNNLKWL